MKHQFLTTTIFFVSAIFASSLAKADGGLFIEPGVRYETLTGTVSYPSPLGSSDVTSKGFGVSAKLGFEVLDAVFLALDATYGQPTLNINNGGYNASGPAYSYGPTVGIQMPVVGLRVWGTYIAGGEYDPASSGSLDLKFKDLRGYRVGVGFHIAVVSLNLEYEDAKYGTSELQQIGPFAGGSFSSVDMTNRGWILGVSFPVSL